MREIVLTFLVIILSFGARAQYCGSSNSNICNWSGTSSTLLLSPQSTDLDPFDIHKPFKFEVSVIETTAFFEKMVAYAIEEKGIMPGGDAEVFEESVECNT
jgi:hypothetical protein